MAPIFVKKKFITSDNENERGARKRFNGRFYINLREMRQSREASEDLSGWSEKEESPEPSGAPETMECPFCKKRQIKSEVVENKYVCGDCGGYFRVRTGNRIKMVADKWSFTPWFQNTEAENPLDFPGYMEKLKAVREKTGLSEGVTIGRARIYGEAAVLGVCDARFLMGSMGHVVGERIAAAVEKATQMLLPVILFCCSGGARMQEGMISLMQMAKTAAALKKHSEAGLLYVPVLTDPTTGGVTASFAMLGDIILAEPGALIGFAGPRVIEQTIGQKLPEGFQRAEFLLEHGFVDMVLERNKIKQTLSEIVSMHYIKNNEIRNHQRQEEVHEECGAEGSVLSAWEKVQISRDNKRPSGEDYIENLFDDFIEFHGDRYYGDDSAVMGGIARFHGMPVTVIAQVKGHSTKENIKRNFLNIVLQFHFNIIILKWMELTQVNF